MKPPHTDGAALPPSWGPAATPGAGSWGRLRGALRSSPRARLAVLAAASLPLALALAAYVSEAPRTSDASASASASQGTAQLGTATCARWQAAGAGTRQTIIYALAAAATQPDPENHGATLSQGAAYGLFERVCASDASRSLLLYEAYNRAASMGGAGVATSPTSVPVAHP